MLPSGYELTVKDLELWKSLGASIAYTRVLRGNCVKV